MNDPLLLLIIPYDKKHFWANELGIKYAAIEHECHILCFHATMNTYCMEVDRLYKN